MDAALKAGLFIGAVLLLGAGFFARWVGPEHRSRESQRRLGWGLALGAGGLLVTGLGEVVTTVTRAVGGFYPDLVLDYLLHTRHGQATLARSGLVVPLLALGLGGRLPRGADRLAYGVCGLGLLASISVVSHSGVMGPLPFLGDLAHLVGACLWAGAVLYFAWVPRWSDSALLASSVRRVSSLGLFSVALLGATGVYASFLHLYGLTALTETSYGLALMVKVGLVLVILALAGANRWLLMPALERQETAGLRRAVRLESLLLVGVLSVTGILTTRDPVHRPDGHAAHQETMPQGMMPQEMRPQGTVPFAHDGHAPADAATDAAADAAAGVNLFKLAAGPVLVEPLVLPEGPATLVLSPADTAGGMIGDTTGDVGFTVVGPDGARHALDAERLPTHHGHDELWLELPDLQIGRWQLLGPAGEAFDFTVYQTVYQGALESGGTLTAMFLPTPSLAGGGLSEVFVYAYEGEAVDERPLFIAYRMPGMEHAGDDERFELEADGAYHDARAQAWRASLSFPMVGEWEVELLFEGEEPERHRFALEVPAD